jgi:hypothetical protein
MLYTVQFFALSAEKFARQMQRSPERLLQMVRRRLENESKDDSDAIEPILSAAVAICRGDLPKDAPQLYFDACYALVSAVGEPIRLGPFCDFRHIQSFEDTGIWPWTQQKSPPFPMPRASELPQFGYLPAEFMREVVLPGFARLPPCRSKSPIGNWCQLARNQFHEMVQSVSADDLDLVCYLSVW